MRKKRYGRPLYYHDESKDDFIFIKSVESKPPKKNYRYEYRNPIAKFLSFLLFYVVAVPLVYIVCKIWYGFKVKGKHHKKGIKSGYMVYSNHVLPVEFLFTFVSLSLPRRTFIICNDDAVKIPVVGSLAKCLGALPLTRNSVSSARELFRVVEKKLKKNNVVMVMPEARIWPYYTGIRPFSHHSFLYAVKNNVPVIPAVTTFRKPKGLFKNYRGPRVTVYYGPPVYPDPALSHHENCQRIRDTIYAFMSNAAATYNEVEYYKYIKVDEPVETHNQIHDMKVKERELRRRRRAKAAWRKKSAGTTPNEGDATLPHE